MTDNKNRGMYAKFNVERTDKSEKHKDCSYFVLDLNHDPIARYAASEYAAYARSRGYIQLANDLDNAILDARLATE